MTNPTERDREVELALNIASNDGDMAESIKDIHCRNSGLPPLAVRERHA